MKEKFKELLLKYPNHCSAYVFSKLVYKRNMCRNEIIKWFNLLVDKEDWKGSNKVELIRFYYEHSKK